VDVPNNADLPDPPDENENVDECQQNDDEEHQQNDDKEEDDEGDDDGIFEQEQAEAEEPIEEPMTPASLKKLADTTGALPPILESRTRRQTQNNRETLVTGTVEEATDTVEEKWNTVQPLSEKKRKLERELQNQNSRKLKTKSTGDSKIK
jgi:hypothetical protein